MISPETLINYIETFANKAVADAAIDEINKQENLREALDTPIGKILFESIIKRINGNVMQIVAICSDKFEDIEKIRKPGMEINLDYELLKDWAVTIAKGEAHITKMKGMKP